MSVIYIVEQHDHILELWRAQQVRDLRVLHLDFHDDMRGLLIDRDAQRAYRIWDLNPVVGQGNFLTHAVLEGRVSSIRWVHDEPGGRKYDVGTVKYKSDLSALPYHWLISLQGEPGVPIHYQVVPYKDWTEPAEGECLDIDWDFFACTEYPADTIQSRTDSFLERAFNVIPQLVYVCYSPDYSHPSRTQFKEFISDLSQILKAEVIQLEFNANAPLKQPYYKRYLPVPLFRLARRIYYKINLELRKRGVY